MIIWINLVIITTILIPHKYRVKNLKLVCFLCVFCVFCNWIWTLTITFMAKTETNCIYDSLFEIFLSIKNFLALLTAPKNCIINHLMYWIAEILQLSIEFNFTNWLQEAFRYWIIYKKLIAILPLLAFLLCKKNLWWNFAKFLP